jgi:hypothetical protein
MLEREEFYRLSEAAVKPGDQKCHNGPNSRKPYLWVKHVIAGLANPSSIVEIGVRAGYSAYAFLLACPKATYTGFDAYINGRFGGKDLRSGFKAHAERILAPYQAKIVVANTMDKGFALPKAGFFHVDGDHTFNGALHDLELCLIASNPDSVILVDDYVFHPEVGMAAQEFCKRHGWHCTQVRSLRGEGVVTRDPNPSWLEPVHKLTA